MKKFLPVFITFASIIAGPCAFAFDSNLVGTWTGTLKTKQGPVVAVWTINPNGSYRAQFSGAQAIPEDQGDLVADAGRWRRRGSQSSESGTYSIPGPGRLITIGSNGLTEWKRSNAGSSVPVRTASGPAPSNSPTGTMYSAFGAFSANSSTYSPPIKKAEPQHVPGAYDPRWNPANFASQTAPQDNGSYQAPPTRAYNPYARQPQSVASQAPMPISGNLQNLLFKDFPLPAVGDEVQQYGLPALGRAAAGGMRKRDFRLIY